jgi:hypothetical protein
MYIYVCIIHAHSHTYTYIQTQTHACTQLEDLHNNNVHMGHQHMGMRGPESARRSFVLSGMPLGGGYPYSHSSMDAYMVRMIWLFWVYVRVCAYMRIYTWLPICVQQLVCTRVKLWPDVIRVHAPVFICIQQASIHIPLAALMHTW